MIGPSLKFFVVGGVILMLTGALQLVVRPLKPGENRYFNRGIIWAGFCIAAGLFAVLLGAGYFPVPGR